MKIDADDLAKIKEVYNIPLEHFIHLVLGKEAGKEYSLIVLRERFEDAEIMTVLEMCENSRNLKMPFTTVLSCLKKTEKGQSSTSSILLTWN
jgi:hypothetical protein